jgi:hypothetical protein
MNQEQLQNLLEQVLPAVWRLRFYLAYALVGVALGATGAGFLAAGVVSPVWLLVAGAVYQHVGAAFGLVAAANVLKPAEVSASGARRALVEDVDDIPAEPEEVLADSDALS